VDFERGEAQLGAPRLFEADLTYRAEPGSTPEQTTVQVNEPLVADGAKVFLVGHGYAPRFIVRDSRGSIVFDDTVVFLPQDGNFTSTGVIKIPDAEPSLGFTGLFLPTAALTEELGPHSIFPAPDYPAVFLSAFTGDLGMDSGAPQSVYTLDTSSMEQVGLESLIPGDTWQLPEGLGSIEFVDFDRWASFQIAHDPGKELALLSSVVAMLGLMISLFVRRRRMWVRATATEDGGTLVEVAALGKTEAVDLEPDVVHVAARMQAREEPRGGQA
jgi:cytochrome c biogenesis protein